MRLVPLIRSVLGLPAKAATGLARVIVAKFDAAATNPDNRRHWRNADHLDANAALNPFVRKQLRERARYEVANNSYLDGMLDTRAYDIVGPDGPSIDLETDDEPLNDAIEDAWNDWAQAVGLAEKLHLACRSKDESGEVFLTFFTNEELDHPIKLDVRLIESDQVAHPSALPSPDQPVDGIDYDASGNPIRYWLLRSHPGSALPGALVADPVAARNVIHYFRAKRPGQGRGYPLVTASLPLWAYLRRFTLATVQAAETAASFAAVMKTPAAADGEGVTMDVGESMPIERGAIAALPEGWELQQLRAEHPTTTFTEFVRQLIREAARCLSIPLNVALGDSSSYNYASGRLDHQSYDRTIRVERALLERVVLQRIFRAWMEEAVLVEGFLPQQLRTMGARMPRPSWLWSSREHVDPAKEANAQSQRLESNTTTVTDELARTGQSFRKVMKRRARELRLMEKLGIPVSTGPRPDTAGDDEDESALPAAAPATRKEKRRAA